MTQSILKAFKCSWLLLAFHLLLIGNLLLLLLLVVPAGSGNSLDTRIRRQLEKSSDNENDDSDDFAIELSSEQYDENENEVDENEEKTIADGGVVYGINVNKTSVVACKNSSSAVANSVWQSMFSVSKLTFPLPSFEGFSLVPKSFDLFDLKKMLVDFLLDMPDLDNL